MKALTYTPTPAKYLATRAGLPGAGALELAEIRPPRAPGPGVARGRMTPPRTLRPTRCRTGAP